jgi:hypothetical protein
VFVVDGEVEVAVVEHSTTASQSFESQDCRVIAGSEQLGKWQNTKVQREIFGQTKAAFVA